MSSSTTDITVPFSKIEGEIACKLQLIRHRNGRESLICRATLENGTKEKLIASLSPLIAEDSKGHDWEVSLSKGLVMATHSYAKERWLDAMHMFHFWLEIITSMIREAARRETDSELL